MNLFDFATDNLRLQARMMQLDQQNKEHLQEMAYKADQYDQRMAFADLEADASLESRVHHNTRNDWKGQ